MSTVPDPSGGGVLATPGAVAVIPVSGEGLSRGKLVLRRVLADRRAVAGFSILLLLVAVAFLSPYLSPGKFGVPDYARMHTPPSAFHWFGVTQSGADLYAETMRGLQKSLVIGLVGALLATAMAAVVGAFAGYFGGILDRMLTSFIDLLLVLPAFLIIAILSPLFVNSTWLIFVLLLAGFQWMITARIVRGMTLSLREREFVQAARYMGVPAHTIIFRHILPNMASLLIVDATVNVSALILAEVGLSYFGFGVQTPDVSLGTLIYEHWGSAIPFPWEFYFPAGFVVVLVLAVNLVGDGLRDALDPNSMRSVK